MSIRSIVTRGYGNGVFVGSISLVAVRGYGEEAGTIPGGYTPFMVYDFEEAEYRERQRLREKRQRERDDAQLLKDIQEMVGPSQKLIDDIWTAALLQIDEKPDQVIEVAHDIDDRSLTRLMSKLLNIGILDSEKVTRAVIKSPDSTVTFMKTEGGWLFFRTKGNA